MDFKEFCAYFDGLGLANIPFSNILEQNKTYTFNDIKKIIEVRELYLMPNGLVGNDKYDEAIQILNKDKGDICINDIHNTAELLHWEEYINRFETFINCICDTYNSTIITKN